MMSSGLSVTQSALPTITITRHKSRYPAVLWRLDAPHVCHMSAQSVRMSATCPGQSRDANCMSPH